MRRTIIASIFGLFFKSRMKLLTKKFKTIWWRIKSVVARYYYGNPSKKLKIVGVTGTNGKTTTVTILYKITTALGYKAGLIRSEEHTSELQSQSNLVCRL